MMVINRIKSESGNGNGIEKVEVKFQQEKSESDNYMVSMDDIDEVARAGHVW